MMRSAGFQGELEKDHWLDLGLLVSVVELVCLLERCSHRGGLLLSESCCPLWSIRRDD